jgi:hypothetical protein
MEINGYTFSPGNSKLGKIWNISHTPVKGCPADVPCANSKGCYAHKSYALYAGVRKAWDGNYGRLMRDADESAPFRYLVGAVSELCHAKKAKYFRIHVAGDFLSQEHLAAWHTIATVNPGTKFRVFTKNYTLYYKDLPDNLKIGFSMWPGWTPSTYVYSNLSNWQSLPKAWLMNPKNPDNRIPTNAFICPGSCVKCKHCWNKREDVILEKH